MSAANSAGAPRSPTARRIEPVLTPLEVRQLRSFVAIAQEGQVTRAANKLYVAQPALSQMLAKLEAQVGTQLLERYPRGVHLTAAGEAFLEKALVATAAVDDAEAAAEALARSARATLAWGFIGVPPMVDVPELYHAIRDARPDVDIRFRELALPATTTARWLASVDVALCYAPTPHPDVETFTLRTEPRVALLATGHPLAGAKELLVSDVLEETFCGADPELEPERAGFWTLDDHRGGPAKLSGDLASTVQEVVACVAAGSAIATAPASCDRALLSVYSGIASIVIADARSAPLKLVWRRRGAGDVVETLVRVAREMYCGGSRGRGSVR